LNGPANFGIALRPRHSPNLAATKRLVPKRHSAELGFQHETRRDQIAVVLRPTEHGDGVDYRLDDVPYCPARGPRLAVIDGGRPRLHSPNGRRT